MLPDSGGLVLAGDGSYGRRATGSNSRTPFRGGLSGRRAQWASGSVSGGGETGPAMPSASSSPGGGEVAPPSGATSRLGRCGGSGVLIAPVSARGMPATRRAPAPAPGSASSRRVSAVKPAGGRAEHLSMTRLPVALAVTALTVLLTGCGAARSAEPAASAASDQDVASAGRTLVIGSVSDDPEEEAEVFQPFIDHVAAQLGGVGVTAGEVVVAQSLDEMAELLRSGQVDLYVDSMNGVTSVVRDGAGVPLLRRWKDGAPEYHSVVVTRRDSGIETVGQLRGRTVAFEEETSTDGYFLAAATLLEQGLSLVQVSEPSSPVPADRVGFVFSGDDENTVFLVLDGRVDAGALSDEDLAENAGSRADELVAVTRTIDVPRHGVVGRTGLEPAIVQALTAELTTLHETAEGRSVLEEFDGTGRFDTLTGEDLAPVLGLRRVLDVRAP